MADAETAMEEGSEGVAEYGVSQYARMAVLGSTLAALGYAIAAAILGLVDTALAPIRAFASGMATFINGTLLAPVRVTDAGAAASVASFVDGIGADLGIFAFPAAMLSVVIAMTIFLWFIRRISISPLQLIRRE